MRTRNFLKPMGSVCLVFLLLLSSILGIRMLFVSLLCTPLLIILGFCQFCLILRYQSDWYQEKCLNLFLRILGSTRG